MFVANSVDRSSDATAVNCDAANLTAQIDGALASLSDMGRAAAPDDVRLPKCPKQNVTTANSDLAERVEVVMDCRTMVTSMMHRTDMLNIMNCTANGVTSPSIGQ